MSDTLNSALGAVRLAPAKLNLTLSVGPRRADGYHELHSVMVPLGLADRLSVAAAHGPEDSLHVTGDDGPARLDDLVLQGIAAARRTARAVLGPGADPFPLAARLEKRIPVAAGLGGGSSDAAASLEASLEAWGVEDQVRLRDRVAAAVAVGSDVPFFLVGRPVLVEGRGERLTPLRLPGGGVVGVLLVTPDVAVSTAEVFRRLDGGGEGAPSDPRSTRITSEHLAQELLARLPVDQLVARAGVLATANDLVNATATLVPELRRFRRAIAHHLGRPVGQSGSGPTLWALYPSAQEAEAAAADLEAAMDADRLGAPGSQRPRVHATTMVAGDRIADDAPDPGREPR